MKNYTEEEIKEILEKHYKWLYGNGEEKANLRYANLREADLSSADLRYANLGSANLSYANLGSADLRYADLGYANLGSANLRYADLGYANLGSANLREANLSSADLRYANLSSADLSDTILEGINWLAYLGIVPDSRGMARAYKVTNAQGGGIYNVGMNYVDRKEFSAELNYDVALQCSWGINLATLAWCLNEKQDGKRLFLMTFKVSPENVCVPIGSDGKFRVAKCRKIGECDWQGNLFATSPGGKVE